MYYVYVLKSLRTGLFYKGLTDNLERRLKQHVTGRSKTTKKYLPIELAFVQICSNRKEARELEKYLKSGCGREIIQQLI